MFVLTAKSRAIVAAAATVIGAAILPSAASAQGFIDFLWGGDAEWGGKRQTVSFSPQFKPNQVIVSFGDRRLYLVTKPGQAISYPIAVPREQSRWQGVTAVSSKRENPSWTPTPDMMKENPLLPSWVPGGHPMNPLGVRALYLGASTYRIHGTDAPWTIGQAVSKGCIRMFNEDVLDLYPRVPVGMKVTVTWDRFNADGVVAADDAPSGTSTGSSTGSSKSASSSNPFGDLFGGPAEAAASPPPAAAAPPRPSEGIYTATSTSPDGTTTYTRRVGGGAVSRAAQSGQTGATESTPKSAAPQKTSAAEPSKAQTTAQAE